jgi:predicted phosphoribosyltransferase
LDVFGHEEEKGARVFDLPELRNRIGVFRDRADAGSVLARMLEEHREGDVIAFAVPAGGVPVGAVIARELRIPLEVAVVSKITPPWNSEVGYGAVAFDGTYRLNEALVSRLGLTHEEVELGVTETRQKVAKRVELFCGERSRLDLKGLTVVVVDDGLASGFTMRVAVHALLKAGAEHLVVGVPTAHEDAALSLAREVAAVYCPNVRGGLQFAVADAYQRWRDVDEEEAQRMLSALAPRGQGD